MGIRFEHLDDAMQAKIQEAATIENARKWNAEAEQLFFVEDLLGISESEIGWRWYDACVHSLEDLFLSLLEAHGETK